MNSWSIVFGVTGALVLAGACVYVAGFALPEEHIAERSRKVRATVEHVTERVRSVQAQPHWRRVVTRIEVQMLSQEGFATSNTRVAIRSLSRCET